MSKLLITGATGLLGSRFVELLHDEWEIVSFAREALPNSLSKLAQSVVGDITDFDDLPEQIDAIAPDYILHAAAFTNVDECEQKPELALKINGQATRAIANIAKERKVPILYVSTDFVFAGQGEYFEDSQPEPINVYGQSKLVGEEAVMALPTPWQIVRIAFPYRAHFEPKVDLVRWMINNLKDGQSIKLIDDQEITPTFIDDAVFAMAALLVEGETGIYHAVSPQPITPYAMGLTVCDVFGFNKSLIEPIAFDVYQQTSEKIAQRPRTSILRGDNLDAIAGYQMLPFFEGLARVKAQL